MDINKHQTVFTELHSRIKEQAEKSLSTLTDRAYQIDQLLQSDLFVNQETISASFSSPVPPNHHLDPIVRVVQNHLRHFIEIAEHITIWLELEIPSYTEGDDFRIVVQNEILDDIASMKAASIIHLSQFVDYHEQRAAANKELSKRPQLDDNYHLVLHLDKQFHRNLKLMLVEVKSHLLRICHLLTKNKDLIQRQSTYRRHVNNYF